LKKEDFIKAGERALVEVYGGKVSDSLEAIDDFAKRQLKAQPQSK